MFKWNPITSELDLTGSSNAGGAFSLKNSATLGAAASSLEVTGLDLNTDKVYKIMVYALAGASSPIIGWQANADSTSSNYRVQRIEANSTTVAGARLSSNSLGLSVMANQTLIMEMVLTGRSGGYVFGSVNPVFYNTIGSPILRAFAVGWVNNVDNMTSFHLLDISGGTNLAAGTQVRIFTMGF